VPPVPLNVVMLAWYVPGTKESLIVHNVADAVVEHPGEVGKRLVVCE